MNDRLSKYRGSLLGLAIGDALGVPVEFKKPGSFEDVFDFQDSSHFSLPAGHWSDDTAMALCLANSLIEKQGFDPVDQIEKYQKWLTEGYCSSTGKAVGVGQTVLRALISYEPGGTPYRAISSRFSEGNGSLMRLAPAVLWSCNSPRAAMEYAALSSQVTHGSRVCTDACRYYAGLIIGAINGVSKEILLGDRYSPVAGFWEENSLSEEIRNVASGSFKRANPPVIEGSGYVVKSMEAALWAFYSSESFEEGALKAVNLGDDADTTAATYGQLAGAYYGVEGIPERWVRNVAKGEEIRGLADGLFALANR